MRLKFSDNSSWEMDWDKYPPVERREDRPGLSDFYNEDAITVDQLAYQALLMLRHPNTRQRREVRRTQTEAQKLLWDAFEKLRQICEAKGLEIPEEYDQEHKVHYFSREWLEVLRDLLTDAGDDRYQSVQAMLCQSLS